MNQFTGGFAPQQNIEMQAPVMAPGSQSNYPQQLARALATPSQAGQDKGMDLSGVSQLMMNYAKQQQEKLKTPGITAPTTPPPVVGMDAGISTMPTIA